MLGTDYTPGPKQEEKNLSAHQNKPGKIKNRWLADLIGPHTLIIDKTASYKKRRPLLTEPRDSSHTINGACSIFHIQSIWDKVFSADVFQVRPNKLNNLCTSMLRRVEDAGEYSIIPFKPNIVYNGEHTQSSYDVMDILPLPIV